jgi:hypothetical protein
MPREVTDSIDGKPVSLLPHVNVHDRAQSPGSVGDRDSDRAAAPVVNPGFRAGTTPLGVIRCAAIVFSTSRGIAQDVVSGDHLL